MTKTRTKNAALIFLASSLRQMLTIILTFASRTIFIRTLGADYLGVNGLFSNILTLLSLSELGIGTAIMTYLYKPLVDQDKEQLKSLMKFYAVCYRGVGITIIVLGCLLIPFLPKLVNLETDLPVNLYIVYIIFLLNIASTYLFMAYKQTLVIANQEQYKIEKVNILFTILGCITDIAILILYRNYVSYLLIRLGMTIIKNVVIAIRVDKEYPFLKEKGEIELTKEEKKNFFKDTLSVMVFRLGSVLFNSTDNILISVILSTTIVGYYSNYQMIVTQVFAIITLIINSVKAGIGNVIVTESRQQQYHIFKQLDFMSSIICLIFTICLYQFMTPFMVLWSEHMGSEGSNYVLGQVIVLILSIDFYFNSSVQLLDAFKTTTGNFAIGQYLQLIGGGVNIILSVMLGYVWGLAGILSATIISKALITVLFFVGKVGSKVFELPSKIFIERYIRQFLLAAFIFIVVDIICNIFSVTGILGIAFKEMVSIFVSVLLICIIYRKTTEFKETIERLFIIVKNLLKKNNNKC